eukprot:161823-Chlamydomonas_euryale.AAC.2
MAIQEAVWGLLEGRRYGGWGGAGHTRMRCRQHCASYIDSLARSTFGTRSLTRQPGTSSLWGPPTS